MQGSFAVDYRVACAAADLGVDEGCAYLALARHTASNNRTTTAGGQAITKALGVSRNRAGGFYRQLLSHGFFIPETGTMIKLETWPMMHSKGCTKRQREVIERLANRKWITNRSDPDYQQANRLVKAGIIARNDNPDFGLFTAVDMETDTIWLPNEFVDGLDGVASPLLRLREHRDKRLLLLALQVYQLTNMAEYCGIPWDCIRGTYNRLEVYRSGLHTIWGFQAINITVRPSKFGQAYGTDLKTADMAEFWNGFHTLERVGIIEVVPYILESESLSAMPLMPYAIGRYGDDIERDIATAANDAGERIVPDYILEDLETDPDRALHLCPVPSHIEDVQMVGIIRPRYRAKNQRTAAWFAQYLAPAERHIAAFGALG